MLKTYKDPDSGDSSAPGLIQKNVVSAANLPSGHLGSFGSRISNTCDMLLNWAH